MTLDPTFYATTLQRLKSEGCALLVTGDVPPRDLRAATRALFGAPGESRRRVLALTDPAIGEPADVLPVSAHPMNEHVNVVDYRDRARDASEAAHGSSPFASPNDDILDTIHLETSQALADQTPVDPTGGQVRLSVSSLPPLLSRADLERVERFVRATATQVRGVRGMAHYLLPVEEDAGWVDALSPVFDARIELRSQADGPPEHRWHLSGRERTSAWLDLPVTADEGWSEL